MYIQRDDGVKYVLPNLLRFSDSLDVSNTPNPFPTEDSSKTQIVQLLGQTRHIEIYFTLVDSDTDLSDGTYTSEVKTVKEQYDFLMENFFDSNYTYTLYLDNGIVITLLNLENLSFDVDESNPVTIPCKVTFIRGENIGEAL